MIKINGMRVDVEHFLDGSQRMTKLTLVNNIAENANIVFELNYENDEELMTLYFLVNHMRENGFYGKYILKMHYCPSARMDRTKSEHEVFTLKWTCKFVNSMNFDRVFIMDPHSNVAPALLNNVLAAYPAKQIVEVMNEIGKENLVMYYPDSGAYKKYHELFDKLPFCYGSKDRDWSTGHINGVIIQNEMKLDLTGKTILMIDDIISYGGTMYYGAKKLKEVGVGKIYAFATHTELSVLDPKEGKLLKALEDGTVERLYTTDSIFTGEHEKIKIMPI